MNELLKHIRLGIQARDFFIYDDKKIIIRPLTSLEFDDCESQAFETADDEIAKLVMRLRLGDLKLNDELLNLSSSLYNEMTKYYNTIDFWVVYHAMKDFMPDDFSIEDVEHMRYVHEISKQVFGISSADDDTVIDEVSTKDGKILATIIYKLHQPLVDELWKLSPLQHKFLFYAHPDTIKKVADSWEEFVEKKKNGELLRNVGK